MCSFHVWATSGERLSIRQCKTCEVFELKLYNAVYRFVTQSYHTFCQNILEEWRKLQQRYDEDPIIIPISEEGLDILITLETLFEMYHLLDDVDTAIKVQLLSDMFYRQSGPGLKY